MDAWPQPPSPDNGTLPRVVATQRKHAQETVLALTELLDLNRFMWSVRTAALNSLRKFLERVWLGSMASTTLGIAASAGLATAPTLQSSGSADQIDSPVLTSASLDLIIKGLALSLGDKRYAQVRMSALHALMVLVKRYHQAPLLLVPYREVPPFTHS